LKVKVRLFAQLRELVGAGRLEVEVKDGCKVRELLLRLSDLLPQAFRGVVGPRGELIDGYSVLVNAKQAELDVELASGSEVAILPPVGGGLQVMWVG
jgi:MoaD family protein